jgi:DNA invertase Pin-like site-specific DNA recombinase
MSTDKQEESPEQQRAEILKLAKKHGYHVIRWYEDHAISGGKTLKRKQFMQMISDADLDPDVVIDELHYLDEHLASNESLLARAVFKRVFKTVTLY